MEYRSNAEHLAVQYGLSGEEISMKPIGSGHINTTMLLTDGNRALVVQKLNTTVFPQPEHLVDNARLIEMHLVSKAQSGLYGLGIIKHVATTSGKFLVEYQGEVWRALEFIGKSYSEDVVDCAIKARTAAGAFGEFANALNDFDAMQLNTVIPDFHNLSMRIEKLKNLIQSDPLGRGETCADDIAFCESQFELAQEVKAVEATLPIRVCHNDTKINNMLFNSETNQAKAVIDLDTCMPGYWLYDFGDMVRTFCSPEQEDSTNLSNVVVRINIFEAIVTGYISAVADKLTEAEKRSFILGAKVMPLMIGIRFLTDYLDGDNYFAVKHDMHNLERARNQFALYKDIVNKEAQLSAIINS
ncbi:phosphotransferase enzyme family protein [Pseudoalteromonas luteoviolacea]|nr:aminoglycoside phosphotransferase family protein [Pseudoalteromonas luteoviolacea]